MAPQSLHLRTCRNHSYDFFPEVKGLLRSEGPYLQRYKRWGKLQSKIRNYLIPPGPSSRSMLTALDTAFSLWSRGELQSVLGLQLIKMIVEALLFKRSFTEHPDLTDIVPYLRCRYSLIITLQEF